MQQIYDLVRLAQIQPHKLKLEVTESILAENMQRSIQVLKDLSEIGVGVALDDFGTGYSSLKHLNELPLEQLKIDISFIANLDDTLNNSGDIVQSIMAIAEHMNFRVVAEGVETERQFEQLIEYGCHAFQGFLFDEPVPLNQLEKLAHDLSGE